MLGPLASETFTNASSRITSQFDQNGSQGTADTDGVTATIRYDAATDSYSLTTASGSITFGPGDIDASQSSSTAIVYIQTSGNTTQSLTLTRAGTSGPLTYQYVGSAFWQTTVQQSATQVSGSIDAIVYGVEAPAASVPNTGEALYDIDLIGAVTTGSSVAPLGGTGTAAIDFASGTVVVLGELTLSAFGGGDFSGFGQIGSGENAFSGTFVFEDFQDFEGELQGLFFGPAREEFGATFSAADSTGAVATGALLGREGDAGPGNTTFGPNTVPDTTLANSQFFAANEAVLDADINGSDGFIETLGAFSNIGNRESDLVIRYDADQNAYVLINDEFNAVFDSNGARRPGFLGPRARATLSSLRFNPRFTVSQPEYTRLMSFVFTDAEATGPLMARYAYYVFGFETPDASLTRTGTGGYQIQVEGRAVDTEFRNTLGFGGMGELFVDFASGDISAFSELDFGEQVINAALTGESRNGSFRFEGALSSNANAFSGDVTIDGIGDYTGTGSGSFFGPNAEEVGGSFTASEGPDGALAGGFFGLRDDTITDPNAPFGTLATLTGDQSLPFFVVQTPQIFFSVRDFGFNLDDGTYTFDLQVGGSPDIDTFTFTQADADASQGSTGFDAFTSVYSGTDVRLLVPNADAPIQLTYASFAELGAEDFPGPNFFDKAFLVYGLQTRQMPRTGTATYNGTAWGSAVVTQAQTATSARQTDWFTFSGDSRLEADFGSGSFNLFLTGLTGTLDDPGGFGQTTNFNGQFQDIEYVGNINGAIFDTLGQSNGVRLTGGFFGPNAEEFAAAFENREFITVGADEFSSELTGVALGSRNLPGN